MGNITKNISDHELACKCGKCEVSIQRHEPVIQIVQDVCDHFANLAKVDKVVLIITSAARCYEYNRKPISLGGPGSNDNSQHPRCNAIDFQIHVNGKQVQPQLIYDYLCHKYPDKHGFGLYNTFVHADSREVKARWS